MKKADGKAPGGVANVMDFDTFLSKLGDKDKAGVERHLAECRAVGSPGHAELWMRMASVLATLAPEPVKTAARQALQFFVPDGKYRMQVFALEDENSGEVRVYSVDAVDRAIAAGILGAGKPGEGDIMLYPVKSSPAESVMIESLTAASTSSAPDYYKHMLGWNRRAVRIKIPSSASPAHVAAVEALCALSLPKPAAEKKAEAPAAAPAAAGKTTKKAAKKG